MKEDFFYVGIKEPVELRRSLLESSKLVIQNLQKYEKIRGIREEKLKQTEELKNLLAEIKRLNNKLKAAFPRMVPREIPAEKKAKKEPDEIRVLEQELSEVEEELRRLR